MSVLTFDTIIVPGTSLPSQPWWPHLHAMIVESFLNKNFYAFPPTWTRLNEDPAKGAEGLARELGDNGHIAMMLSDEGDPVACSGVLPFRGENWINDVEEKGDAQVAGGEITKLGGVSSKSVEQTPDWEICCFCVHPSQRGRGLSSQLVQVLTEFIKSKGARRLVSNYSIEETGGFWPKLGFEIIPGAGGVLRKGFKMDPTKEGLREALHFKMGAKLL